MEDCKAVRALKLACLFAALWQAGCGRGPSSNGGPQPRQLTVFAASSLTDAFSELATAFEARHSDVTVVLNFAGSSQLAAQLREGIPADLFASANSAQMQAVIEAGRIAAGSQSFFVSNRLTIVVPSDNPADIFELEDLAKPGVQLILAVQGVPVRAYTEEIVAAQGADFQERFYRNLVSEEDNVRQVIAKVALGEADAGIAYTSDVSAELADQVQQIRIPDQLNLRATYPIAPLVDAAQPDLAQRFVEFVLSEAGQAVLARWGFEPPPGN